jgi:hypothetical protein
MPPQRTPEIGFDGRSRNRWTTEKLTDAVRAVIGAFQIEGVGFCASALISGDWKTFKRDIPGRSRIIHAASIQLSDLVKLRHLTTVRNA